MLSRAVGRYQSTTLLNTTTPSYYNTFWDEGMILTFILQMSDQQFANTTIYCDARQPLELLGSHSVLPVVVFT